MADQAQSEPPLLPVYLFHGDDELKQETLRKRLVKRVFGSEDDNLNLQVFSPEQIRDSDQLLDALCTLPFMAERRLVIIKDADRLSKALSETIVDYLKAPSETTVLALSASKLSVATRLYKAVAAIAKGKGIVSAATLRMNELPTFIQRMAAGFGLSLSLDAAAELLDRIGPTTLTLSTELRRLSAWAQAQKINQITVDIIREHVQRLTESKPWDLADALSRREGAECLKHIRRLGSTKPTTLFAYCVSRLREMLSIKALGQHRNLSNQHIAEVLGRQEWQLRTAFAGARLYSSDELIEALIAAPSIEARMKSGEDAEQLLSLWVTGCCQPRQPRQSARPY